MTVTGDSIASKSLYPYDNLFSCPIYNDDSLIVHIASINSPDTTIIIYTYPNDTIAYLTSYNCNYLTSDTLQLDLNVSPCLVTVSQRPFRNCTSTISVFNLISDLVIDDEYGTISSNASVVDAAQEMKKLGVIVNSQ